MHLCADFRPLLSLSRALSLSPSLCVRLKAPGAWRPRLQAVNPEHLKLFTLAGRLFGRMVFEGLSSYA